MPRYYFLPVNPVPPSSEAPADSPSLVLPSALKEGFGARLINGTQHDQTSSLPLWEQAGVSFSNPDRPLWGRIDPKLSIEEQALTAWRSLLLEQDRCLHQGIPVQGILLGGYAPMVAALYLLASSMRHPIYVAVQGAGVMPNGEKKQNVITGARQIPPPRSLRDPFLEEDVADPRPTRRNVRFDKMIYCSIRPLQEERDPKTPEVLCRKELIAKVEAARLIATKPVVPPSVGASLKDFEKEVTDIVDLADEENCPILLDGPAAEVLLRVVILAKQRKLPLFFLKTKILADGKIGELDGTAELYDPSRAKKKK